MDVSGSKITESPEIMAVKVHYTVSEDIQPNTDLKIRKSVVEILDWTSSRRLYSKTYYKSISLPKKNYIGLHRKSTRLGDAVAEEGKKGIQYLLVLQDFQPYMKLPTLDFPVYVCNTDSVFIYHLTIRVTATNSQLQESYKKEKLCIIL